MHVAEIQDLTEDYLDITPDPHVRLKVKARKEVDLLGEFESRQATVVSWWAVRRGGLPFRGGDIRNGKTQEIQKCQDS